MRLTSTLQITLASATVERKCFLLHPRNELAALAQDVPVVEQVVRVGSWGHGLLQQPEVGFLGSQSRLAMIAGDAGADYVLPHVGPPLYRGTMWSRVRDLVCLPQYWQAKPSL